MKRWLDLFKLTFKEFGEDKAPRLGAALAYYTIFSIGPLLLIAIAMAGIFFGKEAAEGRIAGELGKVFGPQMAEALQKMVAGAAKPSSGVIATIIGVITLLFGAAGVFGQLKEALNTIWNVEGKKSEGVMGFIRERFLSMAMVFGIGFLLLVTLVFDTMISAMGRSAQGVLPGGEAVMQIIQLVISFGLVTVLFAAIFRFLPEIDIEWRDVWFGAAFTAFLFVLGKFGLGLYLGKAAVGSSYGAAGSLVILLVWVYWSAQILFFGAEFTQVYARSHGSMKGDSSKAKVKAVRVEDRPKALAAAPVAAKSRSGLAGKLIGGIAGLFIGVLLGGVTAFIVAMKSVKKLITMPFR